MARTKPRLSNHMDSDKPEPQPEESIEEPEKKADEPVQSSSTPTVPRKKKRKSRVFPKPLGEDDDADLPEDFEKRIPVVAQRAWRSFMPLINKFPRNVLFDEELIVQKIRDPQFASYTEKRGMSERNIQLLPNSHLVYHMQKAFSHEPIPDDHAQSKKKSKQPQTNGEAGPSGFKRPQSPPPSQSLTKKQKKKEKNKAARNEKKVFEDEEKKPMKVKEEEESREAKVEKNHLKERLQLKLLEFRTKRKALLSPEESAEAAALRGKLRRLKKKEKTKQKRQINPHPKSRAPKPSPGGTATPSSRSSSVVSEDGRMIFSKFDFFETGPTPHPKQPKGKNLQHLLNKAESEKRKLEGEDDEKKAGIMRQKKAWQEALLKAQGVKLKNDVGKLKGAIKDREKKKKKSEKKWQERIGGVKKEGKEKQKKREKNLQNRKDKVISKKRKKGIKKGHILPGFN